MPFLNEWGSTMVFFVVFLGIIVMLEDLFPLRGIFRVIFVIILSLIFKNFGYIVMDKFSEVLFMWTDGSIGTLQK